MSEKSAVNLMQNTAQVENHRPYFSFMFMIHSFLRYKCIVKFDFVQYFIVISLIFI